MFADTFLEAFEGMHDLYLAGRKGGGKTTLSFVLADHFLRSGICSGVWANIPHTYPVATSLQSAFIILDEAAQFFDARFSAMGFDLYTMWARKTDSFYVFPSVHAVDVRARNLQAIRLFDMDAIPGLRIWFYGWESTYKEKGMFILVNPSHWFGTFDTKAIPTNDGGLLEAIVSVNPAAVVEMLEARSGMRLKKLLASYGYGGETNSPMMRGGRAARGDVADLNHLVDKLTQRVDELERLINGIKTSGGGSAGAGESETVRGYLVG
jgi:hypothetical protein